MFERIMAVLSYVLILVVIFTIGKLRELYRQKRLKELVSWAVVYNSPFVCSHDMPLWMYIHNAQINTGINEEYHISGDREWQFVQEIIQEFQNDLMQAYFQGSCGIIKSKYEITGECYFMYKLGAFLEKHQCDSEFLTYDMRKDILFHDTHQATYSLTDFSMAYQKLYYIVYMFCKGCKPLNESGLLFSREEPIKEVIDTKQITIYRY